MSENKLAENLKTLMKLNNISPTKLARSTGIGQPVIFRIATGETDNPKLATLRPIAHFFNKSISQLIGDEPLLSEQLYKNVMRVPFISMADANNWPNNFDKKEHKDYVICDCDVSKQAFAVEVQDITMAPQFQPGTILVIDPAKEAHDRDFVVAANTKLQSATFKQLLVDSETKYLKPINTDFRTTEMTDDHKIIGPVLRSRIDFKRV